MAKKGKWSITVHGTQIIPASEYRDNLTIQITDGWPVWLAFGEEAVIGEGICLLAPGDSVKICGDVARAGVYAKCLNPLGAMGGWQEGELEIMVTGRPANGFAHTQIFEGTLTEELPPHKVSVLQGTIVDKTE